MKGADGRRLSMKIFSILTVETISAAGGHLYCAIYDWFLSPLHWYCTGWPKHLWPVTPWDWSCSAPLTLGILTREFQQISHWCGVVWIINNKRQTMTKYGVACVNIHQYIDTHSLSLPGSEPNIFRETSDVRHLSLAARLYDAVIVCDLAWRSLFLVYISCTNNILSPSLSWHIM